MFHNNSPKIGIIPPEYFPETRTINPCKFRHIQTVLLGVLTISAIQSINSPHVLAFEIIPPEAVSTTQTSHQYLGVGNSYNTFQVEVSPFPDLDPMAQLWGFTVSLTPPPGIPPTPPVPRILPNGYLFPETGLKTPLGWQLSDLGQISQDYCVGASPFGDAYCAAILAPTLTFQATNPSVTVSPGLFLGGFGFAYNNGCGVYCGSAPSQLSVIAVSSVPEPITILGSAIALGFGISLKRKLAKPDPKSDNQI